MEQLEYRTVDWGTAEKLILEGWHIHATIYGFPYVTLFKNVFEEFGPEQTKAELDNETPVAEI